MSEVTTPACAHYAAVDALESLEYEHRDCPRDASEHALTFTGDDGRPITVWTDRPACVRREMLQPHRRVSEGRYVAAGYG